MLLEKILARDDFPTETFFNVNIPDVPAQDIRGIRVTTLGRRVYSDSLIRREDPSGREYFWIGGGVSSWSGSEESDFKAVEAGYISLTPLHLDLTNHKLIEVLDSWSL
jgi:5'-nucleotidase